MSDQTFKSSQARRGAFVRRRRESVAFLILLAFVIVALFWSTGRLTF